MIYNGYVGLSVATFEFKGNRFLDESDFMSKMDDNNDHLIPKSQPTIQPYSNVYGLQDGIQEWFKTFLFQQGF